ncbi:MAG: BPL-N domain-containing protein [Candidatus Brocadiales bacterium]|nr:BPL-N domain-containing protein [Candidatus Brocadiales bacterium]
MGGKNIPKTEFKFAVFFFTLMTCLFSAPSAKLALALNGADVALYNDSRSGTYMNDYGSWPDGVTAIENMLKTLGRSYEKINDSDLNYSTQNFSSLYKTIIFPGGYAYWYNYFINKAGKERIRNFVKNGGGYYGICAGAFFASDRIVWEGIPYDDYVHTNKYGELTGYDLDLFPGTSTGPINEIANWNAEVWNMTTFNFQKENSVLSKYKTIPYSEDIIYIGGPYFSIDKDAESKVEVLATYNYNGEPAIVAFEYGSGKVVLSGPHPEIEEDSDRDGVTIDREDKMDDKGSDWELVRHILNWLETPIISHTLTTPSKTTVTKGGTLGPFTVEETNSISSNYNFFVQPYVTKPDKTTVNFSKISTGLDGGKTRTHSQYLSIPTRSELGTFTFGVKLTDTSGNLFDNDSFEFTVVSGTSTAMRRNYRMLKGLVNSTDAQVEKMNTYILLTVPEKGTNKE